MPLCRYLYQTLCRSRLSSLQPASVLEPPRWLSPRAPRNFSIVSGESQHDNASSTDGLDLSNESADSEYLDFLLGPDKNDFPVEVLPARKSRPGRASATQARSTRPSATLIEQAESVKRAHKKSDPANSARPADNELSQSHAVRGLALTNKKRSRAAQRALASKRKATGDEGSRLYIERARAQAQLHQTRRDGVWVRTKIIGAWSTKAQGVTFSTFWNVNMAKMLLYYDTQFSQDFRRERAMLTLSPDAESWATDVVRALQTPSDVFPPGTEGPRVLELPLDRWHEVALFLLYHFPRQMIKFLHASHTCSPPTFCIEDSLKYLVAHFTFAEESDSSEQMQHLIDLFSVLAQRDYGARLSIDGTCIHRLMLNCNHDQVKEMYRIIKVFQVETDWRTILHFATWFAKHDYFEQALDAVLDAKAAGADLASYAFLSNCSTLLRKSIRTPGGFRTCLRLVTNLSEMGLKLNTQLCNIIMLNAVEAGDMTTALSVFDSLVQYNLEADRHSYAILLKGCKINIDDAETLNAVIRSAISHADMTKQSLLATEILHCLALHHTKTNPERAYETVIDAYTQLFDTEPLRRFGLPLSHSAVLSNPVEKRLQPAAQVLGIMLQVHLHRSFIARYSATSVHDLYRNCRTLAEAGEEPFTKLAETDYVANAFLMAFCRTKGGLIYAANVIKDMQRPLNPKLGITQCPPTQQSWSIFLHGFTRHGDLRLAEQVLTYMRGKGIEPNQVTWNSLVGGYAATQDMEGMLDTLKRLEASGSVWDEITRSNVKRFRDQENFMAEWRKEGKENATLDFTEDLRSGLERRISTIGKISPHAPHSNEEVWQPTSTVQSEGSADDDGEANTQYNPFKPT